MERLFVFETMMIMIVTAGGDDDDAACWHLSWPAWHNTRERNTQRSPDVVSRRHYRMIMVMMLMMLSMMLLMMLSSMMILLMAVMMILRVSPLPGAPPLEV